MTAREKQFSQTVTEQKSTIYTVCYMFSQDADEVSDLFQEVLLNLWKGFDGFEHRSDIRTWVYRVALNTCITHDRKKRRTPTVRLSLDVDMFDDRDEDTRQADLLRRRIARLQLHRRSGGWCLWTAHLQQNPAPVPGHHRTDRGAHQRVTSQAGQVGLKCPRSLPQKGRWRPV
jgi:RNA polymerase sigma-70 factor (ECF subfamily)